MKNNRTDRAYLLRLWSVTRDGQPVWFFSLKDPFTGERYGFNDLRGLFNFLQDQINQTTPDAADFDPVQSDL